MSTRHSLAALLLTAALAACIDPALARVPNSHLSLRPQGASVSADDPSTREYGPAPSRSAMALPGRM
jgi:hypothetical protein